MPPGGNVKYYTLWRMEHFCGRTKDLLAISEIIIYCTFECCGKQHSPNRYRSASTERNIVTLTGNGVELPESAMNMIKK